MTETTMASGVGCSLSELGEPMQWIYCMRLETSLHGPKGAGGSRRLELKALLKQLGPALPNVLS